MRDRYLRYWRVAQHLFSPQPRDDDCDPRVNGMVSIQQQQARATLVGQGLRSIFTSHPALVDRGQHSGPGLVYSTIK